jgi:hypothetical protein
MEFLKLILDGLFHGWFFTLSFHILRKIAKNFRSGFSRISRGINFLRVSLKIFEIKFSFEGKFWGNLINQGTTVHQFIRNQSIKKAIFPALKTCQLISISKKILTG